MISYNLSNSTLFPFQMKTTVQISLIFIDRQRKKAQIFTNMSKKATSPILFIQQNMFFAKMRLH